MTVKKITTPLTDEVVKSLKSGDSVLITGIIYTGRDQAHKRLVDTLKAGKPLPVDLKGQIIYYVGPAPAKPGYAIGPAGPTTSVRMDPYTPALLEYGMKGMIGKGNRSQEVIDAIKKYTGVYFASVGGAAALIAKRITRCEVLAYEDIGAEALMKLTVLDFPAVVVNDCYGNDLYEEGMKKYRIA
jgi:fumarate hydratase subunit beta